jgi:hypothetical protein
VARTTPAVSRFGKPISSNTTICLASLHMSSSGTALKWLDSTSTLNTRRRKHGAPKTLITVQQGADFDALCSKFRLVLAIAFAVTFSGCASWRFAAFSDVAERFTGAALREDSATMSRMAATEAPVHRMLTIARNDRALVAAAAKGLRASFADMRGDTAAYIAFEILEDRYRAELGFKFVRQGDAWLVSQVQVDYATDVGRGVSQRGLHGDDASKSQMTPREAAP